MLPRLELILYWVGIAGFCGFTVACATPNATLGSISLPPIEADKSQCESLRKTSQVAARAEAACQVDADCGIRPITVCDVQGLGCYTHITNPAHPTQPLDEALTQLHEGPCPVAECDCQQPPTVFRCEKGQCVEKVCWENVKVKCDPDSTCPESHRVQVPCP
jgi:hypothetical protein